MSILNTNDMIAEQFQMGSRTEGRPVVKDSDGVLAQSQRVDGLVSEASTPGEGGWFGYWFSSVPAADRQDATMGAVLPADECKGEVDECKGEDLSQEGIAQEGITEVEQSSWSSYLPDVGAWVPDFGEWTPAVIGGGEVTVPEVSQEEKERVARVRTLCKLIKQVNQGRVISPQQGAVLNRLVMDHEYQLEVNELLRSLKGMRQHGNTEFKRKVRKLIGKYEDELDRLKQLTFLALRVPKWRQLLVTQGMAKLEELNEFQPDQPPIFNGDDVDLVFILGNINPRFFSQLKGYLMETRYPKVKEMIKAGDVDALCEFVDPSVLIWLEELAEQGLLCNAKEEEIDGRGFLHLVIGEVIKRSSIPEAFFSELRGLLELRARKLVDATYLPKNKGKAMARLDALQWVRLPKARELEEKSDLLTQILEVGSSRLMMQAHEGVYPYWQDGDIILDDLVQHHQLAGKPLSQYYSAQTLCTGSTIEHAGIFSIDGTGKKREVSSFDRAAGASYSRNFASQFYTRGIRLLPERMMEPTLQPMIVAALGDGDMNRTFEVIQRVRRESTLMVTGNAEQYSHIHNSGYTRQNSVLPHFGLSYAYNRLSSTYYGEEWQEEWASDSSTHKVMICSAFTSWATNRWIQRMNQKIALKIERRADTDPEINAMILKTGGEACTSPEGRREWLLSQKFIVSPFDTSTLVFQRMHTGALEAYIDAHSLLYEGSVVHLNSHGAFAPFRR